jgi:hypothetical protein
MIRLLLKRLAREHIYDKSTIKTSCWRTYLVIRLLLKRLAREHIYDKSTINASCWKTYL